jgi:serine/threonine-protein kinase
MAPDESLPAAPEPTGAGDPLPGWVSAVADYELGGEIARGGMGIIFRGHDPHLGRDLAIKVLRPEHHGEPALRQRFLEEAQIGGQLQHPGIAPVHHLGEFPDGRPYFTMKLIKGTTLAALLAARREPTEDVPRLVGVFEQVCQTLAYAHSRGVLHRDLKPGNVMVGAFGEVQVMDWGLAKVLAVAADAPEPGPVGPAAADPPTRIRTVRSGGTGQPGAVPAPTQAGTFMGTPEYMAPEQARGEVDNLDARCDVFGLGAILCEILTGRPPYAATALSPLGLPAGGDALAAAHRRLDGCGADAALIELAKRCLAEEARDRPRDAGVVAAAVAAYRQAVAERLRQAELERATAAVRAGEERKRRRLRRALAAAVLVLVLGGGARAAGSSGSGRRPARAWKPCWRRRGSISGSLAGRRRRRP